jgi:hypothetical protein
MSWVGLADIGSYRPVRDSFAPTGISITNSTIAMTNNVASEVGVEVHLEETSAYDHSCWAIYYDGAYHQFQNLTIPRTTNPVFIIPASKSIEIRTVMTVALSSGALTVNISQWTSTDKTWTSTNTEPTSSVTFTLSGLESAVYYNVYVDGNRIEQIRCDSGTISISYSGPWSAHEFEVVVASGEIPEFGSSSLPALLGCLIIVTVTSVLRRSR